jgi:serine/threonine protein kinase
LTFFIFPAEFHSLLESEAFTEPVARFYGASILLILEDLHQENIVYRSMAPEFLTLDENGYLCVIDLRYAKRLEDKEHRTFTVCGTPEYMPPEQVAATGKRKCV